MNTTEPHDHGSHERPEATHPAAPASPISPPAEWDAFQIQDKRAAAIIVGLMASIFTTGLLLYLGVCYWVAG